jgi:hypothetical protein
MFRALFIAFLGGQFLFSIPAAPASAQEFSFFESGMAPGIVSLSVGGYNLRETTGTGNKAGIFQLDLVPDFTLMRVDDWLFVHPYVGGWVTTDESRMAYGGIHALLVLAERVEFRPFVAVGPYAKGDGEDLRSDGLFHTGGTVFYVLESGWRFDVTITHQSHGHLFSSTHANPGSESVMFSIAVPFGKLL